MIKKIVLILALGFMMFGCGSKKAASRKKSITRKKPSTETVIKKEVSKDAQAINIDESVVVEPIKINSTQDYIDKFGAIAQDEMRLYNIPASITLAQGILESNSGKGRLSIEANNHFGIKCHEWTGAKIYHDDDEKQECFRKYNDAKYSYRDHSLFLTTRKRYGNLFDLKIDDYKKWAKELKAAGYATDKKYPDKLISLIERYALYKLDDEVLGDKKTVTINALDKEIPKTYKVVKGDTLYSISKKYNLTVKELQDLNGLKGTEISIGQELIISSN